jgi:hypothetical protein
VVDGQDGVVRYVEQFVEVLLLVLRFLQHPLISSCTAVVLFYLLV